MSDFNELPDLEPKTETPEVPDLLTPSAATAPLSDEVITNRARRADFAMGEQSPGMPTLKAAFQTGQEPQVRQMVAGQAQAEHQAYKLKTLQAIVSANGPITGKDMDTVLQLGKPSEANPETAIEDKFAQNWVSAGIVGDPQKNLVFQSAFEQNPEGTQEKSRLGTAMASRALQARNLLEEAEAAFNDLPWFSGAPEGQRTKADDMARAVLTLGFRTYVNQRNLASSLPSNSILPGSNKLEQIQQLYLLPQDQFLPALKQVAGPGSKLWKESPGDAMDFIRAAVSFSTSDAYVDNAMAVFNAATLLPFGTAMKAIGRLRNGSEVPSLAMQTAQQAAEDILRRSSRPPATPGGSAMATATDVLAASPKPPEAGYYAPKAALQKIDTRFSTKDSGVIEPANVQVKVDKNGTPTLFNEDGFPVDLHRTPEEGTVKVNVSPSEPINTYRTRHGNFEFTADAEGTKVDGKKTIFVNKKDYETLSQVLDEEKNYTLLNDDKGYFVADLDNKRPGKLVPTSRVPASRISTEPKEGLYPIHLPEGTDKVRFGDFGAEIKGVNKNEPWRVTFGPEIAPRTEVETRNAIADIVKSVAETNPVDAMSKMGLHDAAAIQGAQEELVQKSMGIIPKTDAEVIRQRLPSLFSPQTFYHNASSLTLQQKNRLVGEAQKAVNEINTGLSDPLRVERMTKEALDRAVSAAKEAVRNKYNRFSDALLDQVTHWDSQANTYSIESRFGKRDGTLFDSSSQAEAFRNQYGLKSSAIVQQQGTKFYLSHMQAVDETFRAARDGLVVSENETPRGFFNTLLNAVTGKVAGLGNSLRSARYTTSEFQMNNRIVATHAPVNLRESLEHVAKGMNMTTEERRDLQRILEINRDTMHEDGRRGQFYTSAREFEDMFFDVHGKMPTENQVRAYDNYVRLSDTDWLLRAYQLKRDKERIGLRNYSVSIKSQDADGRPISTSTEFFNAKEVPNFDPANTQDANIYVVPEGRFTTKFAKTVNDAEMQAKIKSGEWKILQVADPREKPLKDLTGISDDLHFVVTDAFDDKAIHLGDGMAYEPGGHVIYQDPYFMKMPMVGPGTKGKLTHFGDISVKTFASKREADYWVGLYNEARDHLLNNREAELQAMFNAGKFPETAVDFKKWFTGGSYGVDTKHPFVVTTAGRDTFQSSEELAKLYPGLREQYSSYNLSSSYNKEFLAERDRQLDTIQKTGTEANPMYANVLSKLADPYTALQTGLAQIVRERWMGDYKTSAAESWINEFWHLFPQDTLSKDKLLQNPWYWLYHAQGNMDAGLAKTNPEAFTAAMVSRKNVLNFLGARDETSSILAGLERRALDWLAPKLGAKTTGKIEETFLPAIKNTAEYARAAAFNAVDGLWNVVQLVQQAQGIAHVTALSPVNGLKGITAQAFARLYRHTEDPGVLADMFDKATKMGWDRAEIEEAWDAWKRSGVHSVGGETAMLNQIQGPNLFKTATASFFDKGRIFFKAGESIVRDSSFFTAYLDWRRANPGMALDNRAMGDIMNRFDTLSMNMTRASNAAYNEGLLSIPTQFYTWNARFTEQMLGKQLTMAEKARVVGLYSAIYGVPSTLGGITFGVLPYANYDDIRQYALANGINAHDKLYQAFSEGIPAMLANIVSGHETDFQRFSPNANMLRDVLAGKKDAYQTIVGASGGFFGSVAATLYPFGKFAWEAMKGNASAYPLKGNDVINVLENVSSFNNGEKSVLGFTLGKLWTKKEQLIDNNIDTFESAMLALGLNPKRDTDVFAKKDYMKTLQNVQDKMKPMILQNWNMATQAMVRGDIQTSMDYMTRVKALSAVADLSLQDQADLFKQATRGNEDLLDATEKQWQQNLPSLRNNNTYIEYLKNLRKYQ